MGSSADESESDSDPEPEPDPSDASTSTSPLARPVNGPSRHAGDTTAIALLLALSTAGLATSARADTLADVRQSGRLVYGSDKEGGGPYAFPDPDSPRDVTGFEVELM